jgi:hypothetical protein
MYFDPMTLEILMYIDVTTGPEQVPFYGNPRQQVCEARMRGAVALALLFDATLE